MTDFYKKLPYFKAKVIDGSKVVKGNLVNDRYGAVICTAGYYPIYDYYDDYGDEDFILDHAYEVDPDTIEVITFEEFFNG